MSETTVQELKKALIDCSVEELAAIAEVVNKAIRVKAKRQEADIERLLEQCSKETPALPPMPPIQMFP